MLFLYLFLEPQHTESLKNYKKENINNNSIVLKLSNVSKTFYISDNGAPFFSKINNMITGRGGKEIKAISDVNLDVGKGEFIGVIGRNGSGKSTLLKLIMGSMRPDKGGAIISRGKMLRLALGMGFDPNLTARDNIYLNGTILGLTFKKIGERFEEIINFAELHDFVDTPVRFYSSGMKSRLSFAVAIHADADIFLIDEFFGSVGDSAFKEKSQKAFEENILKGKTIIHVSHSMQTIKKHCSRVVVMNKGKATVFDNPVEAVKYFQNPSKQILTV